MILYIVLPFLVLYIAPNLNKRIVLGTHKRNQKRDGENLFWIFLLFSISFVWMYGLRDMGGADDAAYRLYYENNYGGSIFSFLSTDKEPLFNVLKMMGNALRLNYKALFLGYAIIDICFLNAALKNYYKTKSGLTLYLAGFYFIAFSAVFTVMRQAVATSMLFYLYSLDKPSWKKRALMWGLIACTHYGFLILLPFEIIIASIHYKLNRVIKIALPMGCLIIGSVLGLTKIVRSITNILGLYDYMNGSANYNNVSNVGVVTTVLFLIYIYVVIKTEMNQSCLSETAESIMDKITYGNMMYFSIMFLTSKLRWGNRLGYYYIFTVPMLIPILYNMIPIKKKQRVLKFGFITVLFLGFVWVMNGVLGESGYVWSLNFR